MACKGMGVAEDWDAHSSGRASDRNCSLKLDTSTIEGICQGDRVRMNRRNEIGPRSEVLSTAHSYDQVSTEEQSENAKRPFPRLHRCNGPGKSLLR